MTLRRSFSAASTFSSLVILLEARRLPPFSVDRAGTRPSSMDLTRPPSNSFRVLTQRSLLVPVLHISLSPLWILSPREVRHTEDLWIEASTTGHVTWQSPWILDGRFGLWLSYTTTNVEWHSSWHPLARIYARTLGRLSLFPFSLCRLLARSHRLCPPQARVLLRCFWRPSTTAFSSG